MTTQNRFARILVIGALAAGCGGASEAARPKPLEFHLKAHHLAQVPQADKNEMLAARADLERARQEKRKAESAIANSTRALDAANKEASRAAQQKEAADSKRSQLEDSKDWELKNRATRDQRVAEVTLRAADQKVQMIEAHRAWLEKWVAYTRENLYAVEAKYELAKANVARAHNISPPDFAHQAFVDQHEKRRRRADKLRGPADREKDTWLAAKKEWEARRRDELQARGVDTAAKSADSDDSK